MAKLCIIREAGGRISGSLGGRRSLAFAIQASQATPRQKNNVCPGVGEMEDHACGGLKIVPSADRRRRTVDHYNNEEPLTPPSPFLGLIPR